MNNQPEALRLADLMEQQPWPLRSERIQVSDELRRQHAEIERLNTALRYEQDRSGRIGTHGPGCHLWGYRHHECLEREYKEAIEALRYIEGLALANDWRDLPTIAQAARTAIAKAEVKV